MSKPPINLDLYKEYKKRTGNDAVGPYAFYAMFRILLACDAAHDFLGSRNKQDTDFKNKCTKAIKDELEKDLVYLYGDIRTKNTTYKAIEETLDKLGAPSSSEDWFKSDSNAQAVSKSIMRYFGFGSIKISDYTKGDCSGDYSIVRILDIMNDLRNDSIRGAQNFKFHVDMSTATSNLIPILSAVLKNNKNIDCGLHQRMVLTNDIASKYDPANVETIYSVFKANNMLKDEIEEKEYIIKIGENEVIRCKLTTRGSVSKKIIKLNVTKFFSNENSNFGIDNDVGTNGVVKNNSVRGLIEKIKTISDSRKIYETMISKTFGDFLQVMSFLDSNSDYLNVFITGDHICHCIASLFSRYVIGETLNTPNPVEDSLGIYVIKGVEALEVDAAPSLIKMSRANIENTFTNFDMLAAAAKARRDEARRDEAPSGSSKRQRGNNFGKKDSISNLSIKTLKERLKSVGIKVTKTIQGKRKELSRIQLEALARKFKNLQIKARSKAIKLKTKKGNYKSEVTLVKELEKIKTKNKTRFGS